MKEGFAAGGGGIDNNFGQDGEAVSRDVLFDIGVEFFNSGNNASLKTVAIVFEGEIPEIVHGNKYYEA